MEFWSLRKVVNSSLGLALLLGAVASFAPFYFAAKQMKDFCATLAVGSSLAAVQAQSAQQGYDVLAFPDGRIRVHDPASYGRRNCNLSFDAAGLRTSVFSDGD
jgi:hypothetical protein